MTKQNYTLLDIKHAYLAGFIDGEGCISTAPASHYYNLTVTVVNSSRKVLQFIQEDFGGAVHRRKREKAHHSTIYSWLCTGKSAARMLKQLYPYFVVKKELARLGIILMDSFTDDRNPIANRIHEINTPRKRGKGMQT